MNKILIFLFSSFTLFNVAYAQQNNTTVDSNAFYSQEFKWGITLPKSFVKQSNADYLAAHKKGAEELGKTMGGKIDDQTAQICSYKSGPFNYFEANKQPYDPKDGSYEQEQKIVKSALYTNFASQMQGMKIDTLTSRETIDGLSFDCFKVVCHLDESVTLNNFIYSRLFGGNEFTVSIVYVDEKVGKGLLNSWRHSTFGK